MGSSMTTAEETSSEDSPKMAVHSKKFLEQLKVAISKLDNSKTAAPGCDLVCQILPECLKDEEAREAALSLVEQALVKYGAELFTPRGSKSNPASNILLELVFPLMWVDNQPVREVALRVVEMIPTTPRPECWNKLKTDMHTQYCKALLNMVVTVQKDWPALWKGTVQFFGMDLHSGSNLINQLLGVIEKAYKNPDIDWTRVQAFECWHVLIDSFVKASLNAKRIALILIPLKASNHRTENLAKVKYDTFVHLIKNVPKTQDVYDCLKAFLHFCFFSTGDAMSPLRSYPKLQLLCIEALEIAVNRSCEGKCAPRLSKQIALGFAQCLQLQLSALDEGRIKNTWVTLLENISQSKGSDQSRELIRDLLLMLEDVVPLSSSCNRSPPTSPNTASSISSMSMNMSQSSSPLQEEFSGLLVELLYELLSGPSALSPSQLASVSLYVGNDGMMGTPALMAVQWLLTPGILLSAGCTEKYKTMMNHLINVSLDCIGGPLSFIPKVLKMASKAISADRPSSSGSSLSEPSNFTESLTSTWCSMAEVLVRWVNAGGELNQGDAASHDFSCLYAVMQFPIIYLSKHSSVWIKIWGQLYQKAAPQVALASTTGSHEFCDQISSRLTAATRSDPKNVDALSAAAVACGEAMVRIVKATHPKWGREQENVVSLLAEVAANAANTKNEKLITALARCVAQFENPVPVASSTPLVVKNVSPVLLLLLQYPSPDYHLSQQIVSALVAVQAMVEKHWQLPSDLPQVVKTALSSLAECAKKHSVRNIRNAGISLVKSVSSTALLDESSSSDVAPLVRGSILHPPIDIVASKPTEKKTVTPTNKTSFFSSNKSPVDSPNRRTKRKLNEAANEEFVVIKRPTPVKMILTEHQKEVMRRKADIPAMYQDLSQDTQSASQDCVILPSSPANPTKKSRVEQDEEAVMDFGDVAFKKRGNDLDVSVSILEEEKSKKVFGTIDVDDNATMQSVTDTTNEDFLMCSQESVMAVRLEEEPVSASPVKEKPAAPTPNRRKSIVPVRKEPTVTRSRIANNSLVTRSGKMVKHRQSLGNVDFKSPPKVKRQRKSLPAANKETSKKDSEESSEEGKVEPIGGPEPEDSEHAGMEVECVLETTKASDDTLSAASPSTGSYERSSSVSSDGTGASESEGKVPFSSPPPPLLRERSKRKTTPTRKALLLFENKDNVDRVSLAVAGKGPRASKGEQQLIKRPLRSRSKISFDESDTMQAENGDSNEKVEAVAVGEASKNSSEPPFKTDGEPVVVIEKLCEIPGKSGEARKRVPKLVVISESDSEPQSQNEAEVQPACEGAADAEPDEVVSETDKNVSEHDATMSERDVTAAKPDETEPEHAVTVWEPDVMEREPEMTVSKPDVTEREPEVTVSEPDVAEREREVTVSKPDVTEREPEVTVSKPDVTEREPEVTVSKPDVTERGAEETVSKPDVTAGEPEVTVSEPNVTERGAEETVSKPDVTAREPEVTVSEPNVTERGAEETVSKPDVTAREPEVTVSKPDVTESGAEEIVSKPNVTECGPKVTVSKPDVTECKPVETVSKPNVAEREQLTASEPDVPEPEPDTSDSEKAASLESAEAPATEPSELRADVIIPDSQDIIESSQTPEESSLSSMTTPRLLRSSEENETPSSAKFTLRVSDTFTPLHTDQNASPTPATPKAVPCEERNGEKAPRRIAGLEDDRTESMPSWMHAKKAISPGKPSRPVHKRISPADLVKVCQGNPSEESVSGSPPSKPNECTPTSSPAQTKWLKPESVTPTGSRSQGSFPIRTGRAAHLLGLGQAAAARSGEEIRTTMSPNRKEETIVVSGASSDAEPCAPPPSATLKPVNNPALRVGRNGNVIASPRVKRRARTGLSTRFSDGGQSAAEPQTPGSEWIRKMYQPNAIPDSSILKKPRRTAALLDDGSPSNRKKRVSFHDPPVSKSLNFYKTDGDNYSGVVHLSGAADESASEKAAGFEDEKKAELSVPLWVTSGDDEKHGSSSVTVIVEETELEIEREGRLNFGESSVLRQRNYNDKSEHVRQVASKEDKTRRRDDNENQKSSADENRWTAKGRKDDEKMGKDDGLRWKKVDEVDEDLNKLKEADEERLRIEELERLLKDDEERIRKEEEERIRKEEEERIRKEEEEQTRKEEEERIRKAEEERIRKAEEERIRKAEEEQIRKAEEERIRKEEEEQVRKQKEERIRKEEEERIRKQEEERIRKEEEERIRKEEEERIRKEEEERSRKEEEERSRKEEEERIRKEEEERSRKEEEERSRKEEEERIRKEEEERIRKEEEERIRIEEDKRALKEEEGRVRKEEEERIRKQEEEEERIRKQEEEERIRIEEEKRARKEEEGRVRKEEEERIRKQEEEEERIRKQEEEERIRIEEGKQARKEEEERVRKEKEERVRKEEEERVRTDEEERVRKEEEKRVRKDEEERVRKEEEKRICKQEEEQRICKQEEEERIRKQEEEERIRKQVEKKRIRKEEDEQTCKEKAEKTVHEEERTSTENVQLKVEKAKTRFAAASKESGRLRLKRTGSSQETNDVSAVPVTKKPTRWSLRRDSEGSSSSSVIDVDEVVVSDHLSGSVSEDVKPARARGRSRKRNEDEFRRKKEADRKRKAEELERADAEWSKKEEIRLSVLSESCSVASSHAGRSGTVTKGPRFDSDLSQIAALSQGDTSTTHPIPFPNPGAIYPSLVNCDEPISVIVDSLTGTAWRRTLLRRFSEAKLTTVGHLASLTEDQVNRFAIRPPRKDTLVNALEKYKRQCGKTVDSIQVPNQHFICTQLMSPRTDPEDDLPLSSLAKSSEVVPLEPQKKILEGSQGKDMVSNLPTNTLLRELTDRIGVNGILGQLYESREADLVSALQTTLGIKKLLPYAPLEDLVEECSNRLEGNADVITACNGKLVDFVANAVAKEAVLKRTASALISKSNGKEILGTLFKSILDHL